ncbi:MAG: sigma-70 family RNA polymerase sigma factor [Clostridiaceae bacterium]|nr:sigma-70 family RNA polymerase sigma factor [Clostridiaceae bacterium]
MKEGVQLDENLLNELKKDPEKGLISLMNTYMGLVYVIVKDKLGLQFSREDIEECVSTVFYEFYKQRDSIDLGKGSIKSFLAVIAKRRAVDLFRANNRTSIRLDNADENSFECCGEQNIADAETKHVLIQGIKDLGIPDSEIFIRKYYLGQSTKMISQVLGLKVNTIDKKISRGLVKLREALGGVLLDG